VPNRGLLLDTGPLVAYLDPDEQSHSWVCEQMSQNDGPLITCEPVLTEAFFLLRHYAPQLAALERLLLDAMIEFSFSLKKELKAVTGLRRRYREIPMSLADACVVRLSELYPRLAVLTLDSHFRIYRRNKRDLIPCLLPPGG
jgi:uncharacterized protein